MNKFYTYAEVFPCLHNNGVMCADVKCSKCGWNPIVAKRRKYVIRKKWEEGTLVKERVVK